MPSIDIRLITKVISVICGVLIIGLAIQRFIYISSSFDLSKVQFTIMTINIMYCMYVRIKAYWE